MGHHSIVYGRITGATWKTTDYLRLHRLNRSVIEQIPEQDQTYPWINRSMFSIPNEQGTFREQVITFGASYKSLEHEWHEWLEKFEGILQKLFWYEAILHIEFEIIGKYRYAWKTDMNQVGETNWYHKSPKPCSAWTFTSNGPRTFLDWLK